MLLTCTTHLAQINRGRGQPAYTLRDEVQGRESTYLATINKSPTAKQGLRTTQALGPVRPLSVSGVAFLLYKLLNRMDDPAAPGCR